MNTLANLSSPSALKMFNCQLRTTLEKKGYSFSIINYLVLRKPEKFFNPSKNRKGNRQTELHVTHRYNLTSEEFKVLYDKGLFDM